MSSSRKRIPGRSMRVVGCSAGSRLKKKKASKFHNTDVHAKIQCDAQLVQALIRNNPGYHPCARDAPHICELVRSAVCYVNHTTGERLPRFFVYHGRRYALSYTNLGRVIVGDSAGNKLGSSGYGAID